MAPYIFRVGVGRTVRSEPELPIYDAAAAGIKDPVDSSRMREASFGLCWFGVRVAEAEICFVVIGAWPNGEPQETLLAVYVSQSRVDL